MLNKYMFLRQFKNPKFYCMLAIDAIITFVAIVAAYVMRLDFEITARHWGQIRFVWMVGIPIRLLVFTVMGQYRGMWRYTGLKDLYRLFVSVFMSELCIIAAVVYEFRFRHYSLLIFFMDALFVFIMTAGVRILIRTYFSLQMSTDKSGFWKNIFADNKNKEKVVIIGAGNAGIRILNEIYDNQRLMYDVCCFLDDAQEKRGRTIRGVPVYGDIDDLPAALKLYGANRVFIAIPSATGAQMRRIVGVCEDAAVNFQTLPTISEIMDKRVSLKVLRDVDYSDLLGRPVVDLDTQTIDQILLDSTVLITGCGGSIGSELCRQVLQFHPRLILLIDSCEYNLYKIESEIADKFSQASFRSILGTVQDQALITKVFEEHRPNIVFHAAAYKHVPMLEHNPWEAVSNNVMASRSLMDTARLHNVERFVLVSTDKAVRPTNVMGASKRVAEIIMQLQPSCQTKFMAVRFGNVLGSTGSVVPHFRRQIERGGPVTVTHPDITRYFMTIPEASQLILQAMAMGEGGDIFVLEMGTPVKIAEMAKDLIKLSGKEPGRDIEIVFTGLRPGEKLYEELITAEEDVFDTSHEKIKRLKAEVSSVKRYSQDSSLMAKDLSKLLDLAHNHDADGIREQLKIIVPEFSYMQNESVVL